MNIRVTCNDICTGAKKKKKYAIQPLHVCTGKVLEIHCTNTCVYE